MPGILKDDDEPSDSMPANLLVALWLRDRRLHGEAADPPKRAEPSSRLLGQSQAEGGVFRYRRRARPEILLDQEDDRSGAGSLAARARRDFGPLINDLDACAAAPHESEERAPPKRGQVPGVCGREGCSFRSRRIQTATRGSCDRHQKFRVCLSSNESPRPGRNLAPVCQRRAAQRR
jgi:hypothetical protein